MKYQFYRPEELDSNLMHQIIADQSKALTWIITNPSYEEVLEAVETLIAEAKPIEKRDDMLFWGFDDPSHMPSDCRAEYFYKPSYYAAFFLMKAYLLYPEELSQLPEFPTILEKGLRGTTGREFRSDGWGGNEECMETLNLFRIADGKKFVSTYPDICRELTELITKIETAMMEDLQDMEKYKKNRHEWSGVRVEAYLAAAEEWFGGTVARR